MLQKLKPIQAVKILKEKKITIFSPLEFQRVFNISAYAAQWFIKTYAKKEVFIKLRNGLYALHDETSNYYLIANRIYQPSYVSFETALSFHKMIPETIYPIISATSKISRNFTFQGTQFIYRKIKQNAYAGYAPIKYLEQTALLAEPEKALIDYLYFIDLGKGEFSYERLDLKNIDERKLNAYGKLFSRPSLEKLIKKIYDQFG